MNGPTISPPLAPASLPPRAGRTRSTSWRAASGGVHLDRPPDFTRSLCARTPGFLSLGDDGVFVCLACPVLLACRWWAYHQDVEGVAGGVTADQRAAWRAVWNVRTASAEDLGLIPGPSCGTPAGVRQHQRRGEPLCRDCQQASVRHVEDVRSPRRRARQAAAASA